MRFAFALVIAIASASVAVMPIVVTGAERKATAAEVGTILIGCWTVLGEKEIAGGPPPPADAHTLCFDGKSKVTTRHSLGSATPATASWINGKGTYGFEDDKLVLRTENGKEGLLWASMAAGSVACDVHIRSKGIAILSGCLASSEEAKPTALPNRVIGWVVQKSEEASVKVTNWQQLKGCWNDTAYERGRWTEAADSKNVMWHSYCFETAHSLVENSGWSNGADGEGWDGAWTYSLSAGKIVMRDKHFGTITRCDVSIAGKSYVTLRNCDEGGDYTRASR